MDAIILAGGRGTRLTSKVQDVPKVMAPVNGRPFLEYVLDHLARFGIERAVLATGYMAEAVSGHFGLSYKGIELLYSVETKALGTGGAVKNAAQYCRGDDFFIFNGDTLFEVDLNDMRTFHLINSCPLTLAVKPMSDFERYGSVVIDGGRVKTFREKKHTDFGFINGGVYIIKRELIYSTAREVFSFENDMLETGVFPVGAFISDTYFIDIGVPEDYEKANEQLGFRKALFLDRDGTLNEDIGHLSDPAKLSFLPGAVDAIRRFKQQGYLVIVVTNQAGVAKGLYNIEDVESLHRHINALLEPQGAGIDAFYYCPHHPEAAVEQYRQQCSCRKPAPGLIEAAVRDFAAKGINISLKDSFMAGDSENDVTAGRLAGVGTCVLITGGRPAGAHRSFADKIVGSLAELKLP